MPKDNRTVFRKWFESKYGKCPHGKPYGILSKRALDLRIKAEKAEELLAKALEWESAMNLCHEAWIRGGQTSYGDK